MGKGRFSPVEKKQERSRQTGDPNGVSAAESSETVEYVAPPDGGWGWMVVLSSFLIHVIADGIVYSFGVFLMEFVEYFHSGRGAVSWIGALQPAVTYTVGPLSSALTNRYGCRKVTIIGALIAAAGFIISVWAPNLYYLYVTSGILTGIGFGLIYLPAIVCVAQYFEKKRSFATGLAVCGSGFGTFILAPLTKLLVHEYSWRGAMLILGGFILNIVVCGIIFRPLEPIVMSPRKTSLEPEGNALLSIEDQEDSGPQKERNIITMEAVEILVKKSNTGTGEDGGEKILTAAETIEIINSLQHLKAFSNGKTVLVNEDNSVINKQIIKPEPKKRAQSETSPDGIQEVISSDSGKSNNKYQISASQCLVTTEPCQNIASFACSDSVLFQQPVSQTSEKATGGARRRRTPGTSESSHSSSTALSPLSRKDIFYSGSLQNIPLFKSQPDVYKATVTVVHDQDQRSLSEKEAKKGGCFDWCEEFKSTMKDMLSISLLKNPVFLMFAFSNFFTSIGFNMPFIFLPDRAKLAGVDEDRAALLLSVIGIANTAGRVIFGFLSDRSWVNRLMLYSTALTICGVATALCPIVGGDYGLLVAYAAIFGIFIGVYVSLTSIVLVDLLGLEYLTNSFGLLLLFQGAATFVGPPIAGWLFDWTKSYDISFIMMGILIAISGAMLYFLPLVQRLYESHMPKEEIVHDIQLGKHSAAEDGVEIISIEQISSPV